MMTQVRIGAVLLVVSALIAVTQGHICLMDPPQRGGFNVSDPGDISCFQPTGPCGTVPAGTPQIVLAGTGYAVRLQQNLNHYNPGWPGFIDVAWAMGSNPTSADFTTLATIPDYWPHLQAQQTNFSIPITLPNINCDRCTLRVRYNPHKPTEPVFHNCADIKIVTPVKQPKGRFFGWAQSNYQDSFLVEINLDGSLKKLAGPLPVRLDSKKQGAPLDTFTGFANGLIAVDKSKQQLYMIGYNVSNTLDDNTQPKPSTWVHFDLSQNQFVGASPIVSSTPNAQWVAVVTNNGGTTYPALVVELVRVIGSGYKFQVRNANYYGGVSAPIGNFPFDNTFVNFFWSEFDENKQILYILSGDENSLFELNVRLYSLNTATGQVSYVSVDNSKYTVTSIHVDSATGNLYTLSPGLYPQTKPGQWTVVSINPSTGGVTPMGAGRGLLEPYADWYGGGVYGGNSILSSSSILYQFQKPNSGATVLSMIDIAASKTIYSTTLNTGVNNPLTLQSVTFIPPPQ